MIVRHARSDEIEKIQKIYNKNQKFVGFVMKDALANSIQRGFLIVAEDDDGEVIGATQFHIARSGYISIYDIASLEKGRGAGTAMVDWLKMLRRDIKLKVTEDNPIAHRFYEKNGFIKVGADPGKKRPLRIYAWRTTVGKLF